MLAVLSILKLILILIWSLFAIVVATVVYLFSWSPNISIFLAKHLWSRVMLFLLGSRINVIGKSNIQKGQHYLIIANHTSYADIPTLFRTLPWRTTFIGKNELKKIPFLGFYMKMAGMIFIDRTNPRSARASIKNSAEIAKKGKNVVIFPEGTTIKGDEIAPFKRGAILLAKEAESVLLPIRIMGTHKVWPITSNLQIRGGKITVIIGEPIPYSTYEDKSTTVLLDELRSKIVELENQA